MVTGEEAPDISWHSGAAAAAEDNEAGNRAEHETLAPSPLLPSKQGSQRGASQPEPR